MKILEHAIYVHKNVDSTEKFWRIHLYAGVILQLKVLKRDEFSLAGPLIHQARGLVNGLLSAR